MIELGLAAVLAAAVVVAEGGVVFQPALSPDGSRVAYAADEGGSVSIYVAPSDGAAWRTRVASIGQEGPARRLAARALLHRPWSPNGASLLYLAPQSGAGDAVHERLFLVGADGKDSRPVGPAEGLIESAAWLTDTRIVFSWRKDREAGRHELRTINLEEAGVESRELYVYENAAVVDLTPSPDGKWVAVLYLSGDRDARRRQISVLGVETGRESKIEGGDAANFLSWSGDSSRLFWLDTLSREAKSWTPAQEKEKPVTVAGGLENLVLLDGYVIGVDAKTGDVVAHRRNSGERRQGLGSGHIPVHAAGGKLALIRKGSLGAAVVVADVSKEAIEAGDIGLGGPTGAAQPPEQRKPESPRPAENPDGGAAPAEKTVPAGSPQAPAPG